MSDDAKRRLNYFISRFVTRIIPFGAIVYMYGLFKPEDTGKQLTGWSIIAVTIIVFTFYKDIKEKAEEMHNSKVKHAMTESKVIIVMAIIFLFIQWAKSGMFEIEKLVLIIMITQAIALYPSAVHRKLVQKKKEEKEKRE